MSSGTGLLIAGKVLNSTPSDGASDASDYRTLCSKAFDQCLPGCLEERGPLSQREVVYWHRRNERSTVQRGVLARRKSRIGLIEKLRRTLLRSLPAAFAIATVPARGIAGAIGQA